MWARRLGAPELWPSYVKVTIQAALVSVMIVNFILYLWNMDVTYLELAKPAREEVICRVPPSDCTSVIGDELVECVVDKSKLVIHDFPLKFMGVDTSELLAEDCPVQLQDSCYSVSYPIRSLMGDLSRLYTLSRPLNPLDAWGAAFIVILVLFGSSILLHDCSLLRAANRRRILSLEAAKCEIPRLWAFIKALHLRRTMAALRRNHKKLWLVVLVPYFVWQAILFLSLAYPLIMIFAIFVAGPIRMSRLMVFLTGALCVLWSVIFVAYTLTTKNDFYAILWAPVKELNNNRCVCWCEYPLQRGVIFRVVSLAVLMAIGSTGITLRALKGLRRANWASLFSVLYAVPINVFPVMWTDTSGSPIKWRKQGEPVQGEPAFDPFALMDEQDESGETRVTLAPCMQSSWEEKDSNQRGIGCCGFPYRKNYEASATPCETPAEVEAAVGASKTGESSAVDADLHLQ